MFLLWSPLAAAVLEASLILHRVPQRSPWEQAEAVDERALFDSHQESDSLGRVHLCPACIKCHYIITWMKPAGSLSASSRSTIPVSTGLPVQLPIPVHTRIKAYIIHSVTSPNAAQ